MPLAKRSGVLVPVDQILKKNFWIVILPLIGLITGHLFIAFGENRYMGGENESSLNVDYTLPGATLLVDDRIIVANGKVTE